MITPAVIYWYRLPHPLKVDYPFKGTKPELHAACYTAWSFEVENLSRSPIKLVLVPSSTDGSIDSPEFQRTLADFIRMLGAEPTIECRQCGIAMALDSVTPPDFLLPEYILKLSAIGIPTLGRILIAWITSRKGRGVSLTLGNLEIKAPTVAQVSEVLGKVEEFLRSKP